MEAGKGSRFHPGPEPVGRKPDIRHAPRIYLGFQVVRNHDVEDTSRLLSLGEPAVYVEAGQQVIDDLCRCITGRHVPGVAVLVSPAHELLGHHEKGVAPENKA
jgi:hypothetical protein